MAVGVDRGMCEEADDHQQCEHPERGIEPLTAKAKVMARLIACQATRRSIASTP
jgi:hypothetical protein